MKVKSVWAQVSLSHRCAKVTLENMDRGFGRLAVPRDPRSRPHRSFSSRRSGPRPCARAGTSEGSGRGVCKIDFSCEAESASAHPLRCNHGNQVHRCVKAVGFREITRPKLNRLPRSTRTQARVVRKRVPRLWGCAGCGHP